MPTKKFKVQNLISNLPNMASRLDTNLVNPWGIVIVNEKLWVADNGTGLLTHYDLHGNGLIPAVVKLVDPANPSAIATPDGIVINRTQGFVVTKGQMRAASLLLISSEDGNIYGYSPLVDTANAYIVVKGVNNEVYKGLTIAGNQLYAADFFNNKIDVFDSNFTKLSGFPFSDNDKKDPLTPHFSPFNIVNIKNYLYVLYALQNPPDNHDDFAGPGNGFINVFNIDGTFVKRLVSRGALNSPWAMIVAPEQLGEYQGKLLVGNFGNGHINVYNFEGKHIATLQHKRKEIITIDGLWGLVSGGQSVFFASGPQAEANGLVGKIRPDH